MKRLKWLAVPAFALMLAACGGDEDTGFQPDEQVGGLQDQQRQQQMQDHPAERPPGQG
ncbi:hypothetical protein [Alkalilimnicola sp. S0819]|uniref:hypothetical protein n=1 Tax=Alkalilimnicola sp. S0819 TaxID=2613922 RepID=UPI00186A89A9|nr:hypothetical protein [Alkalilimnicola sp. S0819]